MSCIEKDLTSAASLSNSSIVLDSHTLSINLALLPSNLLLFSSRRHEIQRSSHSGVFSHGEGGSYRSSRSSIEAIKSMRLERRPVSTLHTHAMHPQPWQIPWEVQLESNLSTIPAWSMQRSPAIFVLGIGPSLPVWFLWVAGSLRVSSMPSNPKAVLHKMWNCPPDPQTRAHLSTTQASLRSKSTTHLKRMSWTFSPLKQRKMAVVGKWPKTPAKNSYSSASKALPFTLYATLSRSSTRSPCCRYYPSSSAVEGQVRRSVEHHYSFSWSASGRNHCSTKLSKNDLSDLINNHAMRDIVTSHRECAIYYIDNSGTFRGTLKTAFCEGPRCYSRCWSQWVPARAHGIRPKSAEPWTCAILPVWRFAVEFTQVEVNSIVRPNVRTMVATSRRSTPG